MTGTGLLIVTICEEAGAIASEKGKISGLDSSVAAALLLSVFPTEVGVLAREPSGDFL